jgi:hypothetical protein
METISGLSSFVEFFSLYNPAHFIFSLGKRKINFDQNYQIFSEKLKISVFLLFVY